MNSNSGTSPDAATTLGLYAGRVDEQKLVNSKALARLLEERATLREALEIVAPYIEQRSERGQAANIVAQSALGVETWQRLGLRVRS